MTIIHTEAHLQTIGTTVLVLLPQSASSKLPSRGMTMVQGTINTHHFQAALEPDGRGSHWLEVTDEMKQAIDASTGDLVSLEIEPSTKWPDPEIPDDLQRALDSDPEVSGLWSTLTTMARWDWIRWIRATSNPDTRKRRIEVVCSKLKAGKRRPCCFNRTACTIPDISRNGILVEPSVTNT